MDDIELLTKFGEGFVVEIVRFNGRGISVSFSVATAHKS